MLYSCVKCETLCSLLLGFSHIGYDIYVAERLNLNKI